MRDDQLFGERQYEFIGDCPPFSQYLRPGSDVAAMAAVQAWFGYKIIRINAMNLDLKTPLEIWILNPEVHDDGTVAHEGIFDIDGGLIHATSPDAIAINFVWPDIQEELGNA